WRIRCDWFGVINFPHTEQVLELIEAALELNILRFDRSKPLFKIPRNLCRVVLKCVNSHSSENKNQKGDTNSCKALYSAFDRKESSYRLAALNEQQILPHLFCRLVPIL